MRLIFETANFSVAPHEKPHVDRDDGGHVVITPKVMVNDRTELSPELAKEMMVFSIIAGKAMKRVMNEHGVDLDRINYQENGNWVHHLHWHLYGRAISAKVQKHGDALNFPHRETGYYDTFRFSNLRC